MKIVYEEAGIELWCGDAHRRGWLPWDGIFIFDPPWDDEGAKSLPVPEGVPLLVFTDPRRLGEAVERFGGPTWTFTWDTMSPWQTGPGRPLAQTKQALFYGEFDAVARDRGTTDSPRSGERSNPSTVRRLDGDKIHSDIWRESLRWLHHPAAGATAGNGTGTARFSARAGEKAFRHAKPLGWMRYLIATCSPGGPVFDPFAGSGTSLLAARLLGRPAIGCEIDAEVCQVAVEMLHGTYGVQQDQLQLVDDGSTL